MEVLNFLIFVQTAAFINLRYVVDVQVKLNRDLCKLILSIWSWSLLQFTLVLTATKERKDTSHWELIVLNNQELLPTRAYGPIQLYVF